MLVDSLLGNSSCEGNPPGVTGVSADLNRGGGHSIESGEFAASTNSLHPALHHPLHVLREGRREGGRK